MMRTMYSGISGIRAHQVKMDVVANNIANVNTVGYKASRVTFQEVLNQTIQPSFAAVADGIGGMNAQQIGLGVAVGSIDVMHNASSVQRTDRPFDVSIAGEGFFMVQDGTNQLYTRAGNFYVDGGEGSADGKGSLVTQGGNKVLDQSGKPITIDPTYTNLSIDQGGNIKAIDATGAVVEDTIGILGIAKFANPQGLMKEGNNLFRKAPNSGEPTVGASGTEGFSSLIPGSLEMSNVDLSQEFTDMIIAQRGFQANSRVITTSNELLQELAGIIR
ncbi:MAG: flagellar basal-body rod protein FlgF [Hyphomonadaceae bacterium]|nr:flagellar basal-body rod protein FlgF [Clostridia bacterium]